MTYAISRYPVHLIDIVRVANGRRVTIRPTLPQDLELQQEFFGLLSAKGRYRRFMSPVNGLPEAVAQRFINVDYRSHLALLAEIFEDGREIMIGETRYVIERGDPASREFAIAVADNWQAKGIGRALLARLEREAAVLGIRRMFADTLYDNKAMLGLAARSGYAIRMNPGDARLVMLEKNLSVSTASLTHRRDQQGKNHDENGFHHL
jgi:GNAT superfamily N-acetyltransferase